MIVARKAVRVISDCLRVTPDGARACSVPRDWSGPLTFANEHLLTPALYASLALAHRLPEVPPDVGEYLAYIHRLNRDRNKALRRQIVELVGALNAAGIVPMLLKGGLALFTDLYPDPAARMIRDIDVLVPAQAVGRAVETLDGLGYRTIARYEAGHNAYGDFARPYDPGAVDLHMELVETPYLLPAVEVWSRARPVEPAAGVTFYAPAHTDAVLHHLLHAQIHHRGGFYRGELELRQVYEFAMMVQRWRDVDWETIECGLATHRLAIVLESYALAARRLFTSPWPLTHAPSQQAVRHYRRCLIQLCWPALTWLGIPLANLRAAFAWHRMNHFYAQGGSLALRRLRHAWQFVHKKDARDALARLFRA